MKVFLFGSVVSPDEVERILKGSRIKPSVAPVYFQNSLVSGLKDNGVDLTVYSLPPIKTFPYGNRFSWGKKEEVLDCGVKITWLPAINLFGLKQISAYFAAKRALKKWLKDNENEKEKIVLSYSVYSPIAKAIVKLCDKNGCKKCAVITDPEEYSYRNSGKGLKAKLLGKMAKDTKRLTELFDGYVFLTKYMIEKYRAQDKPYSIVEGLANPNLFDGITPEKINAVTYTGVLSRGFGIDKLVKAFSETKGDFKLRLFGSGECADMIKEYAEKDSRIEYMGAVERHALLKAQASSKILISVKPSAEEHTKYAFPSKVLEYMTSGTPVLMTKIKGVPDEYFDYCYSIEDESIEGIKKAIEETMAKPDDELIKTGERARMFVIENKNKTVQCAKIKNLLEEIING